MKANTTKERDPVAPLADLGLRGCEHALRTGLKWQGEAERWWSSMIDQAVAARDWQKRWNSVSGVVSRLMPLTRDRLEELMAVVEHNSASGADLLRQAIDAAQTPAIADSRSKWMEVWTSCIGVAQTNAEALTKISNKVIGSWIELIQNQKEVTEILAAKAAC
ncbi:hypothetical protein SBV1_480038 [Verrucomicrobia bacterium]|nr:hypothetical protein SBV1_480038 [Verrucomicrobiota bacterium]